jgi:hypothetical protein
MARAAATYKKGVSLLLALRRPTYDLTHIDALNEKTNTYLRLLTTAGILSLALRDLPLINPLVFLLQHLLMRATCHFRTKKPKTSFGSTCKNYWESQASIPWAM